MLVLRALVRDGVIPLLGPPTSIGDVHHGALYYYLLAPAAALTGGDSPLAVAVWIALAGIAAVGVTWWLARSIGGPVAGLVAGLAMAISPAAVDESTFIWNPNLIALSERDRPGRRLARLDHATAGLVAARGGRHGGDHAMPRAGRDPAAGRRRPARRRRPPAHGSTRSAGRWSGWAWEASRSSPWASCRCVIHELTSDFSEVQAALAYLQAGGDPSSLCPDPALPGRSPAGSCRGRWSA